MTGDEPVDQILAMAEGPVFDLTSLLTGSDQSGTRLMGDGAEEYATHLMDNPIEHVGVSTGMAGYDRAIGGGVRANSVDIIAARPKEGKSQLVNNIGLHVGGQGVPVLNLDTEMSHEEHMNRTLAALAGVDVRDVETGRCGRDAKDREKILAAARRLREVPYHYECIIGKSFEEVLSGMRRWVTRTVGLDSDTGKAKRCVILYDYLKLMSADFLSGDIKEYQALGYVMTALKNFMARWAAGCVCFAQLNRDGIDREDTDVVSGSDRIIHYCTSFTIYKKRSTEELVEAPQYSHKLVPIVSRHGGGLAAGDYVCVQTDYRRGRVTGGPTRYQLSGLGGQNQGGSGLLAAGPQDAIVA